MDGKIERLEKIKAQLDSVSSSMCLAKWLQATIHLYNGNTQSCHHVKSHRIPFESLKTNTSALHNTPKKIKARQQMLNGERPSECNYCWKIEDVDQYSDRTYKSADIFSRGQFQSVVDSGLGNNKTPRYLELAFDNICNLKCMYCSPAYSSSWYSEIKEHGAYPTSKRFNNFTMAKANQVLPLPEQKRETYIKAFWDWWPELSKQLHTLRVTGGEPLLTKHTWQLFDSLFEDPKPHMNFNVNSNLSLPTSLVEKLTNKVNQLDGKINDFVLYCSVDAVGEQAEYIRSGLDFNLFDKNLNFFLNGVQRKVRASFMITVNALSLSGLPALMKYIYQIKKKYPQHHIGLDTPFLQNPEHLSVQVLPKSYTQYLDQVTSFMRSHLNEKPGFVAEDIQRVERIRDLMLQSQWSRMKKALMRRDLLIMLDEMDRRRNLNHKSALPGYQVTFLKWRSLRGLF